MKEEKRNTEQRKCRWLRRILCMILGASLIFGIFPTGFQAGFQPQNVEAASKKRTKACKTYKTFLAKNVSKFEPKTGDFWTKNKESHKKPLLF